jgi:hypothetical protein
MIFFISNSSLSNCDKNFLPKAFQNYRKYRIRLQNLDKDNFDEFQDLFSRPTSHILLGIILKAFRIFEDGQMLLMLDL